MDITQEKDDLRKRYACFYLATIRTILVVTIVFTILGSFNTLWWPFLLVGQFRTQYLIIQILLGLLLALHRNWRLVSAACLASILNASLIVPFYLPVTADLAIIVPRSTLKVLQLNLNYKNDNYGLVTQYISQVAPDVVLVEEFTDAWQSRLADALTLYPYRKLQARSDTYGIAVFSRLPMESSIAHLGSSEIPSVECHIVVAGEAITLLGVHFMGPFEQEGTELQSRQMRSICGEKDRLSGHLILAGDFNLTSWSDEFAHLTETLNLRDSRLGIGLQPTWPTEKPIVVFRRANRVFRPNIGILSYLLRIPIDHFLISKELHVLNRQVGPWVGSDHFPVFAEFAIAPEKKKVY